MLFGVRSSFVRRSKNWILLEIELLARVSQIIIYNNTRSSCINPDQLHGVFGVALGPGSLGMTDSSMIDNDPSFPASRMILRLVEALPIRERNLG